MSDTSTATSTGAGVSSGPTLLSLKGVRAAYGQVRVLHGIDLDVHEGEVVVVLGANGAGKTTTMRAICGMVGTAGSITLDGKELVGRKPADVARMGVAHVPQGRGTFADLSVDDNLQLGAFVRKDKEVRADIDRWYEVFPVLGERRTQQAGTLSGGEQQMLAVARALMGRPRLLLLDEPSLGLAPMIVQDVFRRLDTVKAELGTTMLIVEQNANLALGIADRGYVIEAGHIVLSGTADDLQSDDAVRAAYLGY
ncbi:MAG TPA: ABC transporter ATP-binding protein [Acidimicrobiales bacterium]|nr:ABC transporter ATP-binding protein [Acidimicrobiales bacterium]